jgi:hypothetical protein
MVHLCSGSCTIEALSKPATCWNGGHPLKKGIGVWHCNICKFLICRSCIDTSSPTPPELFLPLQSPLDGLLETASASSSSPAFSANASAPMPQ